MDLGTTMGQRLSEHARERADHLAFVGDTAALTYRELWQTSAALAAGLRSRGAEPGERIAVLLPNDWQLVCLWMACALGGFVFVPVNPVLRRGELEAVARSATPRLFVTDGAHADARTPFEQVAGAQSVLTDDDGPDGWHALAHEGEGAGPAAAVGAEQLVTMLHTSGTTGDPKGVVHDHRFWNSFGRLGYGEPFGFGPDTRYLSVMPLFHVNGLGFAWSVLQEGGTLVQAERFSASGYWEQVRTARANGSFIISAMVSMLLAQPPSAADREHDIRLMGTSALVPDKAAEFEARFGVTLLSSYGMTEGGGCVEWPQRRAFGSAGVPTSNVELRTVDDDGAACPPGTPGRIQIRDRASGLAVGYWAPQGGVAQPIRAAGWFTTADFGQFDDQGLLYFVARVRDRLRRAGENISAVEVEDAIKAHPDVVEAAVIGVPDPFVDEELKAFVLFAEGRASTLEDVHAWLADRLAPFKRPRYWTAVEEFPRTPTQRVKKHELPTGTDAGVLDLGARRQS